MLGIEFGRNSQFYARVTPPPGGIILDHQLDLHARTLTVRSSNGIETVYDVALTDRNSNMHDAYAIDVKLKETRTMHYSELARHHGQILDLGRASAKKVAESRGLTIDGARASD